MSTYRASGWGAEHENPPPSDHSHPTVPAQPYPANYGGHPGAGFAPPRPHEQGQPYGSRPPFDSAAHGQNAAVETTPGQPMHSQPAFGQPAFGQPAFGQPAFGQPAFGQPTANQPGYSPAAPGQPSYNHPAYGQAVPGPSGYGQAAYPQTPHGQTAHGQTPYGQAPYRPEWPDSDHHHDDDHDHDDQDDEDEPPARGHPHGHGHSHGDGPKIEVSDRTRKIVLAILIPAMVITAIAVIVLWPGKPKLADQAGNDTTPAYGDVTAISVQACPPGSVSPEAVGPTACGSATVHLTEGPGANSNVVVDLPNGPGAPTLAVGDAVVLTVTQDPQTGRNTYAVVDHQRGKALLFMLAIAAAIVLAAGRWRGLTALLALAVSFVLLLLFVIPAILNGENPLLVAIIGAIAVMFAVLYLTHGFNVHTSVAILGTLLSLVLTGLLGYAFTLLTKLTGFGSEESVYLSISLGQVDVRGLLLAGIVIGALGVLDDVTITQSSTVEELAVTATSRRELYRAATRVGRNHIASAVNTIVMAYAGASLPLLLLIVAGGRSAGQVVTSELIAQEIVRSAVGTIGLVASVPITTGLATLVADLRGGRRNRRAADSTRTA